MIFPSFPHLDPGFPRQKPCLGRGFQQHRFAGTWHCQHDKKGTPNCVRNQEAVVFSSVQLLHERKEKEMGRISAWKWDILNGSVLPSCLELSSLEVCVLRWLRCLLPRRSLRRQGSSPCTVRSSSDIIRHSFDKGSLIGLARIWI